MIYSMFMDRNNSLYNSVFSLKLTYSKHDWLTSKNYHENYQKQQQLFKQM